MPKMALVVLESDLEDLFLVTVQEAKLVNHGLHRVLEVWAYTFKHAHVVKLEWQQGRPPANGKVLAVHAVEATIFCNPDKVLKDKLEDFEVNSRQILDQLFKGQESATAVLDACETQKQSF